MQIQPIRRSTSVASAVAENLHALIVSGELEPGSRLPSMQTLAEQYGVSVPSVREALAALDAAGLVEILHGQGTFVRTRPPDSPLMSGWIGFGSDPEELRGLIEARKLIEVHLADVAAVRATDEERVAIAQSVERLEESRKSAAAYLRADAEFHVLVAQAAHSPVLLRVVDALYAVLRQQLLLNIEAALASGSDLSESVERHRAVAEALIQGDRTGARDSMSAIIDFGASLVEVDLAEFAQTSSGGR
jgi:GntR family transcriptional repressor for pyruvate dehydrogenase complex